MLIMIPVRCILLLGTFCVHINAMDYVNAMLMYRCKQWQPTSTEQKAPGVPTLEYLAIKKIVAGLSSSTFIQEFDDLTKTTSQSALDHPRIQQLIIPELLKKYKTKIAAAHIAPIINLPQSISAYSLLQLNHNGKLLAKAKGGQLTAWQVDTQKMLFEQLFGGPIDVLCFNNSNNRLTVGIRSFEGEPLLYIVDMQGNRSRGLPAPGKIKTLCYSTDVKHLAVGVEAYEVGACDKIHIWHLPTQQWVYTLEVKGDIDYVKSAFQSFFDGTIQPLFSQTSDPIFPYSTFFYYIF